MGAGLPGLVPALVLGQLVRVTLGLPVRVRGVPPAPNEERPAMPFTREDDLRLSRYCRHG
jgi:hypothetical protein